MWIHSFLILATTNRALGHRFTFISPNSHNSFAKHGFLYVTFFFCTNYTSQWWKLYKMVEFGASSFKCHHSGKSVICIFVSFQFLSLILRRIYTMNMIFSHEIGIFNAIFITLLMLFYRWGSWGQKALKYTGLGSRKNGVRISRVLVDAQELALRGGDGLIYSICQFPWYKCSCHGWFHG